LKLPLWRLLGGILILGAMVAILLALAPVTLENYRLQQFIKSVATNPAARTASDESLTASVATHARELDLPVDASDIKVTRAQGRVHVEANYRVKVLDEVDLHFHPKATGQ
jgi:hypothetical protein